MKLKMKRFLQLPGTCASAAASSVINYYNSDIDFELVKRITNPSHDGLFTPQLGTLLNNFGFNKVTIVTADINKFDFDWKELSKKQIVNKLKKLKELSKDKIMKLDINYYIDFLSSKEYNNEIILDMKFGDYIRKSLDNNKPVLVSFNWQLFFKKPKTDSYGKVDSFKGDFEEHQVVVNGYDDKGVFIIDSHHEMYHGDLEKYQNGRYKIDWETLHTVIGFGDVVLADDYSKENIKYELV